MKMNATPGKARVSAAQKARDQAARKEFAAQPGPGNPRLRAAGTMGEYFEFARFAKGMRVRREEGGLSVAQAAALAGMDEAALSRLECAKGNPTLRTLSRWAEAVGLRLVLGTEKQIVKSGKR